jgi:hypothetical protein
MNKACLIMLVVILSLSCDKLRVYAFQCKYK